MFWWNINKRFYPNVWDIIDGHCIDSETPEETLIRELKEEIGVIPISFSLLQR